MKSLAKIPLVFISMQLIFIIFKSIVKGKLHFGSMLNYFTPSRPSTMASNNEPQNPLPASPAARNCADSLHKSFYGSGATESTSPNNERQAYGHRETIFGLSFSPDNKYLASASQDSTVRIWEVKTHRLIDTLENDKEFECLRVAWCPAVNDTIDANERCEEKYLLATAGADGVLRLFSASFKDERLQWQLVGFKDHYQVLNEIEDRPQIYSLQFVPHPSQMMTGSNEASDWLIMTSADDAIFLWDMQKPNTNSNELEIVSHSVMQFTQIGHNEFGGPRNPNNSIYVFDAAVSNQLVAVALSDGTCRVLSLEGQNDKQCVLSVPEEIVGNSGGHLTAISWDATGTSLATCVACGKVVLWKILTMNAKLYPSIMAVLEGGHDDMRPLFGARYFGENGVSFTNYFLCSTNLVSLVCFYNSSFVAQELVLTWGVDGKVCVWDSSSRGLVKSPVCTLISHPSYPVYALDCTKKKFTFDHGCIAIGGGSDGGFLGVPLYLYDI